MNVPTLDSTISNISDTYADVADALPIDIVVETLGDLPIDEATDAVIEVGERGRRGAITIIGVARRRPKTTLLTTLAVGAAVAALILLLRRRSGDSTQLELADAA
jgi:hypothetical protein